MYRGDRHRPRRLSLRQQYRASVADALAHGETDILTYRQFVKVVKLQRRMARTDPGRDIVL